MRQRPAHLEMQMPMHTHVFMHSLREFDRDQNIEIQFYEKDSKIVYTISFLWDLKEHFLSLKRVVS